MDSDSKHVLTIIGLVACFGAGYFTFKAENREILATGEKFGAFTRIEKSVGDKAKFDFENEQLAIENAVDSYYSTADKYADYICEYDTETEETTEEEKPEYLSTYKDYDGVVYINSDNFHMDGIQGFMHYFKDNPEPDCKGIIIDLRNNRGGFTDYCIGALNNFLDTSETVVTYHYHDGTTEELKVNPESKKTSTDIVILINDHTASAAEIFTSAMKRFYDGNVTTIGTLTTGKGTFQEFEPISDTEKFKYTAGKYTVGDLPCYDGIGITPDIEIPMDYDYDVICTENDIQLQAALDLFK